MKKLYLLVIIIGISILSFSQNIEEEKESIKKVIQTAYVDGLQNEGDAAKIESGFHPDFNLLGIDKSNKMWKYSIADWKSSAVKKRNSGELPLTGDKKVNIEFKNVDVTGSAAMVKIEFFIGTKLTYVDYISLYKFESGWKMVSKIYYKVD
ncbi:MAG: nuclear transport factor 2 family protein [Salinivirgaceae bacterium]|nr:nuclear transport factor 2 family protein [Salinivirgaceae bacterium]